MEGTLGEGEGKKFPVEGNLYGFVVDIRRRVSPERGNLDYKRLFNMNGSLRKKKSLWGGKKVVSKEGRDTEKSIFFLCLVKGQRFGPSRKKGNGKCTFEKGRQKGTPQSSTRLD